MRMKVAIKSIWKDRIKNVQDMIHIREDIEIMSSLNHPHIISIYEVFENKDKIVIVMECASKGELYNYISERHKLSERETRMFFRQIVAAVHCCHKSPLTLLNFKEQNLLLCNISIGEFSNSNLVYLWKLSQSVICSCMVYVIMCFSPYLSKVDSWALGVLLYTLVYGTMPFDGCNHRNLVRQISSRDYHEPTPPSDAHGLIRWMLMVNPERRATIEDIANHWWVNWGYQVSVCDCDPAASSDSPLLAQFINRQHHSRCVQSEGESKVKCPIKHYKYKGMLAVQTSVKKSKKGNDIASSLHEGVSTNTPAKCIFKRPKGILKKINNDYRSHSSAAVIGVLGHELDRDGPSAGASGRIEPTPLSTQAADHSIVTLKKRILKKTQQRESGYYSSPEHSESSEFLHPVGDASTNSNSSTKHGAELKGPGIITYRKKGILKHAGRFSACDVNTQSATLSPGLTESAEQMMGAEGCDHTPTTKNECSLLSKELFHLHYLPEDRPIRSCISAENLLHLEDFEDLRNHPQICHMKCFHQQLVDSSSSLLTDLDNFTQVYKKALEISSKLD
ncbi:NUAK family SNF1-like kinase 1 [Carcharodon carcharias]|uniref:NUAK family SNF1-like kinase 1 n=1 Tax=Carcharodon carcharias TaxID=13397 RepID=UPI001B7F04CE|nr:NUAK family SNF1-like kinase 1 [Carcharodon carcharias]